jgi:ATP synthase protein I
MHQPDALQAKRILILQLVFALTSVAIALLFSVPVAISALVGAGSCVIANALFTVLVFRGYRAQEPARLVMRMYGAELLKLAVLLGLFSLAFVALDDLNLPVLLGAYLAVQVLATLTAAQMRVRTTK